MTKLEAIAHLEISFAYNNEFKKTFMDYIELCILEAIEDHKKINKLLSADEQILLAKTASKKILSTIFSADWWDAQGLK